MFPQQDSARCLSCHRVPEATRFTTVPFWIVHAQYAGGASISASSRSRWFRLRPFSLEVGVAIPVDDTGAGMAWRLSFSSVLRGSIRSPCPTSGKPRAAAFDPPVSPGPAPWT